MTSTPTGLPRRATADTALDAVRSVTGAVPAVVTVTAVVVTRGRSPYLEATLAAVRAQSRVPHSIVVVDVDTAPATSAHRGLALHGARYVAAGHARSFGDAVNAALADADADRGARQADWLWLLHDDAAPAPGALAALFRAVEHTTTVAVAGCKQHRWEHDDDGAPLPPGASDRGVLLQVGYTVSPTGRRMTGLDDTEIDQGQHDAREDVLAVGLAGALVRAPVWRELNGTDAEYGPFGDSLEFCRRVRIAGHRVVVAPDAVVHHAQATLHDPATHRRRRRAEQRFRLVSASPWLLGWVMAGIVLGAPFLAAFRLAVKQPAAARDAFAAPWWMLLGLGSVFRARRRTARTATQPYRVLRPLLGTWRQALREQRERRLARSDARAGGPDDLDRTELRRIAARRHAVLTLVLVAATAVAAVVAGPLVGTLVDGGRFAGGALLPASTDTGQTWTAATSGWIAAGLGQAGPGDPLLLTLTALSLLAGGSLQAGINALFTLALPLAALGGWAAAGAVTRSNGVRAAAAFAWAAAPPLLGALSGGLVGALVAHLALPWAALALVRSVGAQRGDVLRRTTVDDAADRGPALPRPTGAEGRGRRLGAAGAAGLLLAVAVTGAPVILPITVLVLAAAAFAAPSRRPHLALALLPSLAACAPLLARAVQHRDAGLLLADPLTPPGTVAGGPVAGWQALLGLNAPPEPWFGGVLPGLGLGPYLLGGMLVVAALLALAGGRPAGARVGWLLALCALAAVVLADSVLADDAGASGTAPASLILLGLGGAALCGPGRGVRAQRPGRAIAALGVTASVLIGLVSAAGLAAWVAVEPFRGPAQAAGVDGAPDTGPTGLHVTREPVVPAVGQQLQDAPRQARVLQLGTTADGTVEHSLLRADGTQLADASVAARDTPTTDAVGDAAARLAAGTDPRVADRLAELGIGALQVHTPLGPDAGGSAGPTDTTGVTARHADLTASLDALPGIERITQGQSVTVWRVHTAQAPTPGWARVESGPSRTPLPSGGPAVRADVPTGDAGRRVVLAGSAAPTWRATLDGRPLEPVTVATDGAHLQGFELGADGGRLVVTHHTPHRTVWLVCLGTVLGVFALLALPVPGRRPR